MDDDLFSDQARIATLQQTVHVYQLALVLMGAAFLSVVIWRDTTGGFVAALVSLCLVASIYLDRRAAIARATQRFKTQAAEAAKEQAARKARFPWRDGGEQP